MAYMQMFLLVFASVAFAGIMGGGLVSGVEEIWVNTGMYNRAGFPILQRTTSDEIPREIYVAYNPADQSTSTISSSAYIRIVNLADSGNPNEPFNQLVEEFSANLEPDSGYSMELIDRYYNQLNTDYVRNQIRRGERVASENLDSLFESFGVARDRTVGFLRDRGALPMPSAQAELPPIESYVSASRSLSDLRASNPELVWRYEEISALNQKRTDLLGELRQAGSGQAAVLANQRITEVEMEIAQLRNTLVIPENLDYSRYGYSVSDVELFENLHEAVIGGEVLQGTDKTFYEGVISKTGLKTYSQMPESAQVEAAQSQLSNSESRIRASAPAEGTPKVQPPKGPPTPTGLFGGQGYEALRQGLVRGFTAAIGIATGIKTLGSIFDQGKNPEEVNALAAAGAAAGFVYPIFDSLAKASTSKTATRTLRGTGIALAAVAALWAYSSTYKKDKSIPLQFQCLPWQPPSGRKDCEQCNDEDRPCSEYRCKSLGQACGIINKGTDQEKCIWMHPGDTTSPGIKPDKSLLTIGYDYDPSKPRPPGGEGQAGMTIVKQGGGCIAAFTPITFGVETSEPAQCKLDIKHTTKFDDMAFYLGGSNIYTTNHSHQLNLPSPSAINSSFAGGLPPDLQNDGKYTWYIRCKDGNANENRDEFVVEFCVDPGPDLTPPRIVSSSPTNNAPVRFEVDSVLTSFNINEPSNCRWDRKSASYENLANEMTCSNLAWEMNAQMLYSCTANLTGIKDRQENKFYIRCQDISPQQNPMEQSYEYTLIGTQPLDIIKTGPNGTIGGSTSIITVNLSVSTDNGFKNGEAICSYSETGSNTDYTPMFDTNQKNKHFQPLDLGQGSYKYYFRCVDEGGNTVYNETEFEVFVDNFAPEVIRAYNEVDKLKILTDEDAECVFSTEGCNFDFEEGINMPFGGTEHFAEWKTDQNYYIKCKDEYDNQPNPSDCSIVVRPYSTLI